MTVAEAEDEYLKAVRLGQKECAVLQGKGQNPFPVVLDQILGDGVSEGAQNVGTLEIPIERIVGVKSAGRISAFSAGFFPLLDCESEFAMKWMTLCRAHQGDEGIRDPIICYEYLGNFYVQEGNKRLSVLKYYGAIRIPSVVYRIVPPMSDNPEIRAYYEFLDFFKYTRLYDALYTHPGCYIQLLRLPICRRTGSGRRKNAAVSGRIFSISGRRSMRWEAGACISGRRKRCFCGCRCIPLPIWERCPAHS